MLFLIVDFFFSARFQLASDIKAAISEMGTRDFFEMVSFR
jgi:hypothetical protein